MVTVDLDTVISADGASPIAEGQWTGPMIWSRVRTILDDSDVGFLAVQGDLPMAVTRQVRTVPVALRRGLVQRDRGCIHERCDRPPPWTQVMHLEVPYGKGGKLSRTNAALGCHEHHFVFDQGRLVLDWIDGRPVLREPGSDPPDPD